MKAKSFLLKNIYVSLILAVVWCLATVFVLGPPRPFAWLVGQWAISFLFYFALNTVFYSFFYYSWGTWAQAAATILYILPAVQIPYYQIYNSFLESQNISFIVREPQFLLKVFTSEVSVFRVAIILALWLACYWVLRKSLKPKGELIGPKRPYFLLTNRYVLIFIAINVILQIRWCLRRDIAQIWTRPLYPILFFALISLFFFLWQSRHSIHRKLALTTAAVINLSALYAVNLWPHLVYSNWSVDTRFYHALFGSVFVPAPFSTLDQYQSVSELYQKLPVAQMDYNVLIIMNDAARLRSMSSNGYSRPTDDELKWFYEKSFYFKYPVSISNFTDTALPALLSGFASDKDITKIKSNLTLLDYFSKGAQTFFISTQYLNWANLDKFYNSIGQNHLWSAADLPKYQGKNIEDTDDADSQEYLLKYLSSLDRPFVGIWQTYANHFPYTHSEEFARYQPCHRNTEGRQYLINCYDNGTLYVSHLISEALKSIDLKKTVVVITSDHGEGFGEHRVYFHNTDYHEEAVRVPFIWHIPPSLLKRLPKEALDNFNANIKKVVSTVDLLPTLLHLHEMISGQKLTSADLEMSGRSLFTQWNDRVVFSSHCFPQYRCYKRDILFINDDYALIFSPSSGGSKIYDTWNDLLQESPLTPDQIDAEKLKRLKTGALNTHPFGRLMPQN